MIWLFLVIILLGFLFVLPQVILLLRHRPGTPKPKSLRLLLWLPVEEHSVEPVLRQLIKKLDQLPCDEFPRLYVWEADLDQAQMAQVLCLCKERESLRLCSNEQLQQLMEPHSEGEEL